MEEDLNRRFAKMILSALATRAIVDIGDAREAQNLIKKELVKLLRNCPGINRETMAELLDVNLRTIDNWLKLAREEDVEQQQRAEIGQEPEQPTTELTRFRLEVLQLLRDSGHNFVSLGRVVDHVKKRLRNRLSTEVVRKRLTAFVQLGFLECHPDDDELYRLTEPVQVFAETEQRSKLDVLLYCIEGLYRILYQVSISAKGSGFRVSFYEIPESRAEEFSEAAKEAYRKCCKIVGELELQFQHNAPDEPRTTLCTSFFIGRDGRRDELERAVQDFGKEFRK